MKANAYGLGADRVAPALRRAGCRRFFTANPDGALAVKALLPEADVFVLNGLLGEPRDYVAQRLVPVLNDLGQIERWSELASRLERRLPAAVHIDTGMNRLGLSAREADRLIERPEPLDALDVRYLMSHLANAEDRADPMNARQLAEFDARRRALSAPPASLANSSGVFLGPDYHFDLVRPGYAVYGGNPTPGRANPMKPVVGLRAQIVQAREATPGATVGYGATHEVREPTRIATVPLGYADGYLRALGSGATAWIGAVEVPVVGRVSMDLVTLDIGALPESKAHVGTWVDLIRGRDGLDDLAARAGTIGYELLTALGDRYPRVYVGETAA